MSNSPVCQRCENQVQSSWKYCRFCGNKLDSVATQENQPPEEEITIEEELDKQVEPEFTFDRDLYYKVLSSRAERSVILNQKKSIRQEIDALLDQFKSGLIGEETVLPKVKELKEQVKEINKRNKSFSDIPDELPVEILNDQIDAAKQRLRKIDMLKSDENLGKDTIKEAKERTKNSLDMLRDQQSKIFGHLRSWRNELEKKIDETRKEIEHLYVRYKTEELTEQSYKEKKEKLAKDIEQDEEVVSILDRILAN